MTNENTPTTGEIRMAWWMDNDNNPEDNEGASDLAFNRWLAQVKAQALEEFAVEIDASPAVLWIGEGGVKERIKKRIETYLKGEAR